MNTRRESPFPHLLVKASYRPVLPKTPQNPDSLNMLILPGNTFPEVCRVSISENGIAGSLLDGTSLHLALPDRKCVTMQSRHAQPYRLVPQYPFRSYPETRGYRGYLLEIGESGVLVSAVGGDFYRRNGAYMLFVSVASAQLFVDALSAATPVPRELRLPTRSPKPVVRAVGPTRRPPGYRLSAENPDLLWQRSCRGKFLLYRGYSLYVTGRGCTISHLEYGPYRMNGYYVIFQNAQAARAHIDSWFNTR